MGLKKGEVRVVGMTVNDSMLAWLESLRPEELIETSRSQIDPLLRPLQDASVGRLF